MVLTLAAAAAIPGVARAQEELLQELQTIADVRFAGNRELSDGALRRVMKSRPPSWLPWRERPVLRGDFIRSDLVALGELYRHHGFLDAEIDYRVDSTEDA